MAEIIKINDDTWRMEDGGVRFFLLCGTERALLIDSGMTAADARQTAEGLTNLPIMLLNTHTDRDHTSGNGAFEEVYMHPAEEEHYRADGGTGKLLPLADGDVIDLGGRPLRIIHIPGHTPGSVAILAVTRRVLISGDSVQAGNIFMFSAPWRDMPRYAQSMRRLLGMVGEFDTVYPSHGPFPVEAALTGKLLEGAETILRGEASGGPVEMHGRKAWLYKFDFAGFLCDPPAEG